MQTTPQQNPPIISGFIKTNIIEKACIILLTLGINSLLYAQPLSKYVNFKPSEGYFTLVNKQGPAPLILSKNDYPGVMHVAGWFQEDIKRVSGTTPIIYYEEIPSTKEIVLIGTLGKNPLIDKLITENKINVEAIKGKWEATQIELIEDPFENVEKALVVLGSDKRGTIFGMLAISENIGVSPWYWWADVPIKKHDEIYIMPGRYITDSPKVKYRGIFINDEAPALAGWVEENYGGFNHEFYEKVFELLLRSKGNFLWPAMWGRAIYDDDSLSAPLADKLGIVLSTSHHEPLMRAHVEWSRYGKGPWNYEKNPEELRKFWTEGIRRMGNNESLVTIGMRGDGDEAMTEGTAIELLERIVKDQRQIIEEVTGKPASETPQVWALYKEVQDYYDKGMRVPDDVTLLLCDDNWGNIRVLPKSSERERTGGYGIYYHYDFVGGPVSYKWLNVTQIERVWEQMHLAYNYGAERLWLVNVGDIKPMEFPISFFLEYAWDPDAFPAEKLPQYYTQWASQQFGQEHGQEIGEILSLYTKYNARRTPEMLSPDVYSLTNYSEAETIVSDYNELLEKAELLYEALPEGYHDAFYQLVLFPVAACANLNEMYVDVAKNRLYAAQKRSSTNDFARKVEEQFNKDAELTAQYHNDIAGGKWNHMMSQTHIGYTSWNQPAKNIMPETIKLKPKDDARLGIDVQGIQDEKSSKQSEFTMPFFDSVNDQRYYIDLFRQGKQAIDYTIHSKDKWINSSSVGGQLEKDTRIWISINWNDIPDSITEGKLVIEGAGSNYEVIVPLNKKFPNDAYGFIENNGVISIEAVNYSRIVTSAGSGWTIIPNLGRTGSSITPSPVTLTRQQITKDSPRLEYDFYIAEEGDVNIDVYLSPTLNFMKSEGLHFAVSIDDEEPQLINMHEGETVPDWKYPQWWNVSVTEKVKKKSSKHTITSAGQHTLKIWMVDPGVVFQKIVVDCGGLKESYLGPSESKYINRE